MLVGGRVRCRHPVLAARTAVADDDATVFRVVLKGGTSLVSYGGLARVNDRVVSSMPTSASFNDPRLQLVNLSADHVDWDRTTRYAEAARSGRYRVTQADAHYALLTAEIGQALNGISPTTDQVRPSSARARPSPTGPRAASMTSRRT